MITVKRIEVNPIQENCYIVSDETREAVIIDAGAFTAEENIEIRNYITQENLTPVRLLCTHGHFDHVLGTGFICDTYGLQAEIHPADRELYERAEEQLAAFWRGKADCRLAPIGAELAEGDIVRFGTHMFRVVHTPGHTPGGVEFYCAEEGAVFSGDSLFLRSIGRTDFPDSSTHDLVTSLREKILTLPDTTVVYPGHDVSTTVLTERTENLYLL